VSQLLITLLLKRHLLTSNPRLYGKFWESQRTAHLATVGRRSFPVAASVLWNSLPPDIQSSASLVDFCQKLKTHMFQLSYPDILLYLSTYRLRFRGLRNDSYYSSHVTNSDL